MKKTLFLAALILGIAATGYAIRVNPGSQASGDSANTAETLAYRDTNGDFAAGTITVATLAATSALTLTGNQAVTAGSVQVSSAATSAFSLTLDGAYTSAQIAAKTPARAGMLVYSSTLSEVCVSTGATLMGYARLKDAATCQ